MDLGLRDRAAIVTGASRGIGRQIAVDLAREGCLVALVGRDEAALRTAADEVAAAGSRAVVVAVDVTTADAGEQVVGATVDAFGRLDVLVNNAGGAAPKRLDSLTDDDWRIGFDVNFFAAARMATACLPVLRQRGWGRIVNVASTYGREPDPLFGPYSAAKAALLNLTKNLARAFSAEGVLTSCVIPGVTLTELVEANADAAARATDVDRHEVMAKMMAKDPVAAGRFGRPEEVAAAVLFLASEQASWITGAALTVDGSTLRSI